MSTMLPANSPPERPLPLPSSGFGGWAAVFVVVAVAKGAGSRIDARVWRVIMPDNSHVKAAAELMATEKAGWCRTVRDGVKNAISADEKENIGEIPNNPNCPGQDMQGDDWRIRTRVYLKAVLGLIR
jgi:hypothetical protein